VRLVTDVSIRDLRNKGGEIVDRAARGEEITITRDGVPVAELRPVRRPPLTAEELVARRRHLPDIDLAQFRRDIDEFTDQSMW